MDTKTRIELALRAAQAAKQVLSMVGESPTVARLYFIEAIKEIKAIDAMLDAEGA